MCYSVDAGGITSQQRPHGRALFTYIKTMRLPDLHAKPGDGFVRGDVVFIGASNIATHARSLYKTTVMSLMIQSFCNSALAVQYLRLCEAFACNLIRSGGVLRCAFSDDIRLCTDSCSDSL